MKKLFILLAPLILVSEASSANEFVCPYVGANVGMSSFSDLGPRVTNASKVNSETFSSSVYAGYQFYPSLSAELRLSSLGDLTLKSMPGGFKEKGVDLVAKVSRPISDGISAFALGGVRYSIWDAYGKDVYKDMKGFTPVLGGGIEYSITKNIRIDGLAQYYLNIGGVSAVNVGVGASYHWN